jgi:uncharacterized RDD family membrane protein YckC
MSAARPGKGSSPSDKTVFRLVTPEGVPLSLQVALVGDRLAAFLLDAMIILGAVLAIFFLTSMSGSAEFQSLGLIAFFLLRNFYFMFLEHRWQGSTIGKRSRRLRVIDAGGGQLSVEAIVVRNLTRDIEIFIPLGMLLAPQAFWPEAPVWAPPIAGLWVLVLGLLPLFNKQRRRVGDLVAGTMVIASPQVELLSDLAAKRVQPVSRPGSARAFHVFTKKQLSVYGIYELQVLEKVLRAPRSNEMDAQLASIREKICKKIGYKNEVPVDFEFLQEFYAAQRAHLESRMMLGERREDKFGGEGPEEPEAGGPGESRRQASPSAAAESPKDGEKPDEPENPHADIPETDPEQPKGDDPEGSVPPTRD